MALKAVGSSPISHPRKKEKHRTVRAKARAYRSARTVSKRGVRADICTPGGAFFQTRLCAEGKTESTPRRADRKTESGCSAVGSARGLGPRCRRFESCHSDHLCSTKKLQNTKSTRFSRSCAFLLLYLVFYALRGIFEFKSCILTCFLKNRTRTDDFVLIPA